MDGLNKNARLQNVLQLCKVGKIAAAIRLLNAEHPAIKEFVFNASLDGASVLLETAVYEPTGNFLSFLIDQCDGVKYTKINFKACKVRNCGQLVSPLWAAARAHNLPVMTILVRCGGTSLNDVESTNQWTPLQACLGSPTIHLSKAVAAASLLIGNGANVSHISTTTGQSALMLAALYLHEMVTPLMHCLKIEQCLPKQLSAIDHDGQTVLHMAAASFDCTVYDADWLFSLCANPSSDILSEDIHGRNPIISCTAMLWNLSETWTGLPRKVWLIMNSLINIFKPSSESQYKAWRLAGAEVLLSKYERSRKNLHEQEDDQNIQTVYEPDFVDFWERASLLRKQIDPESAEEQLDDLRISLVDSLTYAVRSREDISGASHLSTHKAAFELSRLLYENNDREGSLIVRMKFIRLRPSKSDLLHMKCEQPSLFRQWIKCMSKFLSTTAFYMVKSYAAKSLCDDPIADKDWDILADLMLTATDVLIELSPVKIKCFITLLLTATRRCGNLDQRRMATLKSIVSELTARCQQKYHMFIALSKCAIQHLMFWKEEDYRAGSKMLFIEMLLHGATSCGIRRDAVNPENKELDTLLFLCCSYIEEKDVPTMCKDDLREVMGMLINSKVVHWDAVNEKSENVVHHLTNNILSNAINLQCLAARVVKRLVPNFISVLPPLLATFVSQH